MTQIITDNVGNASDAKVLADTENVLDLRPLGVGTQEVADRREPLGTAAKRKGYALIQEPGPVKGHVALLIRSDANPRNVRLHQIGERTHVGRDVAGARHDGWTAAKYILAADVTDPDAGRDLTIATMHLVPSASHSKAASRLLATQAANAAKWLAEQPLPTDLMGDCNGQANRKEFAPLRKVAAPMSAPSRKGAAIDIHWVTQGHGIAHALDGFSSDHKPVVAEITWAKAKPAPEPARKPAPAPKEEPTVPDFTVNRYGSDTSGRAIWMTAYMHDWWERVVARLGFTPTIVQGAFMVRDGGGAAASAGYHDAAGCIDVRIWDLTASQQAELVRTVREMGAAAWRRDKTAAHGGMDPHCHITLGSDKPLSPGALASWTSYLRGRDGLASNGLDYEWRPSPLVTQPPPPEEDDMQLSDKINKDTTVVEVLREVHNFVHRSDVRHKKMIELLGSVQDRSDVPDDVKAAVKAAIEESALDVNINVHGKGAAS